MTTDIYNEVVSSHGESGSLRGWSQQNQTAAELPGLPKLQDSQAPSSNAQAFPKSQLETLGRQCGETL